MTYEYKPRGMPKRFLEGAPDIVNEKIIDIIAIVPAAPLDYDIVLRHVESHGLQSEMIGVDFSKYGSQGCHFFLDINQMRAYRERNRKNRVYWKDLPEPTKSAILNYLENDE